MADNDIDLYADDIDQDFVQDEFAGDNVDLYDDVISTPAAGGNNSDGLDSQQPTSNTNPEDTNGSVYPSQGNNITPNTLGRRHQLYVGNLSWWTTDQDIINAVREIGVSDFNEVKFFEHRPNGQSKGFCVISMGSENSMRMCMDNLPKLQIHNQNPVVTLPTKQALSTFESQSKTRPTPPNNNGPRGSHPGQANHPISSGPHQSYQPRMQMNSPARGGPMNHGMQGPGPNGPRMQGPPPGFNGPPQMNQNNMRFQQPQWNGPRPNGPGPNMGPMRPPGPGGPQGPPGRPMGPPQGMQGPPRGMSNQGPPQGPPRPDWNRPPMNQGFPQQGPPNMQGPGPNMGPRGPPMGGPPNGPPQGPNQGPAPHVNPAFFNQGGPPPNMGHPMQGGPPGMPPHHGMQQGPHGPHGGPMGPNNGPPPGGHYGPPSNMAPPYGSGPQQSDHRNDMPPISDQEFEDIMARNRTVSSSAIARAVSDAAAGEYASAIETLVTAISLIKQSKVANDDRCKILITSLQDTLRGVEDKSYSSGRRDRSRSRERSHRRGRRERSSSRYRERSRERERDRDRDRDRDRYYADNYRERDRERDRSRSRGGERERERERDYRDRETDDRVSRPRNKSPPDGAEAAGDSSKSRYYEERYRDRTESGRARESDRDRDRERDRRDETHRSRH
ncbi:cleavage and polyadenylation specificity factor subunit 6 isoform X2 [Atheta coriaria]|uniref:cleavage and polyadenylation specificity factor subunit 6 isoform X2 n=1 Tax=Dalotia coriaria TaxID=877792 RepID=UPI0031F37598